MFVSFFFSDLSRGTILLMRGVVCLYSMKCISTHVLACDSIAVYSVKIVLKICAANFSTF